MSDITVIFIVLMSFAAGWIIGHIHALTTYHKRRGPRSIESDPRYDPKQFRR